MKIAVINSGSSSIKFQLFHLPQDEHHSEFGVPKGKVLSHVLVEKIGEFSSTTTLDYEDKQVVITSVVKNHHDALEEIISLLAKHEILKDFTSLDAVGHRVVHGGEEFKTATLIDEKVIKTIESLIPLAPLHNPANLEGILVARKKAPFVKQVAVFDTAFHSHMPQEAYIYALPYEMYEKHKIRRYGFHGTSHSYVMKKAAESLKKDVKDLNLITLHLGNGESACAIKSGVSIDTSMGFTPLEGLVMGTRSGDIDPAIILYMQRELGMSVDEVDKLLNKKSGLLGISGNNDVRSLIESDSEKSKLALDIMIRRIKKYIGSYMALLGRVDAIVFTGGIGEHSSYIRDAVLDNDFAKNIKTLVIETNEELEIANECLGVLKE